MEDEKEDRISDLPTPLIEEILLKLPMKEAAKTSILSTKWRYKWASIPELVFHNDLVCKPFIPGCALVDIVDHTLSSHRGPIFKFDICHEGSYESRDVTRWILHLSKTPIKEFLFDNVNWKAIRISTRLFAFHHLVHLRLSWCIIKLPAGFQGLEKLETLDLSNVSTTQVDIEKLISNSPRLSKLKVEFLIDDIRCLNIDAPNLQVIDVRSSYEDINFRTPNRLVSVSIGLFRDVEYYQPRKNVSSRSLHTFLVDLPLIETLKFKNCGLKSFSQGFHILEKSPGLCTKLEYLSFDIDFGSPMEISAVLCLLRCCPNLGGAKFKPRLWDVTYSMGSFWEEYCAPEPLGNVRALYFSNIQGSEPEIGLIKFLLSNSPGLKKIKVRVPDIEGAGELLLGRLLVLARASQQVMFIYEQGPFKFVQVV